MFKLWIQGDKTSLLLNLFNALLHLLILRSITPSSQEKPSYVSSDLAPPVQLYSTIYFAHFLSPYG